MLALILSQSIWGGLYWGEDENVLAMLMPSTSLSLTTLSTL